MQKQVGLTGAEKRRLAELKYFLKYIYYRSELIQNTIGIDYSEFIALGHELEKEMEESDMLVSF